MSATSLSWRAHRIAQFSSVVSITPENAAGKRGVVPMTEPSALGKKREIPMDCV